jgi:general stress protein CsbA
MIDMILHFVGSYFLVMLLTGFTRNVMLAVVLTIIAGITKEVFFDSYISAMDIASNLAGTFMIAASLKSQRARRY